MFLSFNPDFLVCYWYWGQLGRYVTQVDMQDFCKEKKALYTTYEAVEGLFAATSPIPPEIPKKNPVQIPVPATAGK